MNPVVLVVMDGVGLRDEKQGNAFKQADTPNLDSLMEEGYTELKASGNAVGLPEGYQGNSEVGHLHLGAGRRIPQRLTRINQSIEKNELKEKEALQKAFERAQKNNNAIHLAGIISDGGIHGHIQHLKGLLEAADNYNIEEKYIHCFTDGRDVEPKSASKYLEKIEKWCQKYDAKIATVIGRYYSMDRDKNWALEKTYNEGDYDYFVIPSSHKNFDGINNQDELIFYNFRADRERQIAAAFLKKDFEQFKNPVKPNFTSMFLYKESFDNPVLFEKKVVENTLGEKIEEKGLTQLRVAESQKIPHVTYFFNGQREIKFENEERKFIESDKIKAYDQKPEMHADDITDIVCKEIEKEEKDFILLNYANGDLVGHTGDLEAAKVAMECIDKNLGRIIKKVEESDYKLIITADHGNCEDMGTEENPNTSHTTNMIPLIGKNIEIKGREKIFEIERVVENLLDID
ncbi:MAG: 2,3-bisphosphoglycerate-independent phosphoglycerate mutase [Candidatus Nanohaloarchaea archaeon]